MSGQSESCGHAGKSGKIAQSASFPPSSQCAREIQAVDSRRPGPPSGQPRICLGDIWREAGARIGRQEARRLLEHVTGCSHATLIAAPERTLSEAQAERFAALAARCEAGEPLAYLLGTAWFCGLEFSVTPAVLIPRPETETLVERALACVAELPVPRIADLGAGSGIIAILLARRRPEARITATDISPAALAVAQENAARHGVTIDFRLGDWYAPLEDARPDGRQDAARGRCFDLIVANPPYIAEGDPHLLRNGLPFEPRTALTDGEAGGDGTACLRMLVAGAPAHLSPGGWLLLEHGYDQAEKVRALLNAAGFAQVISWRDGAGIERVSGGRLGAAYAQSP